MAKKRPIGRPTLYRPEYCELLIEHMAKGYSYETFGAVVDVSKQTVYDWEKHPEFLDAKKKAFAKCQKFWEELGLAHIVESFKGKKVNTGIWVFNMKNRFNWVDRIEQATKLDAEINVENSKELIEEFKALLSNKANERKK